jgi:hypothetical protein
MKSPYSRSVATAIGADDIGWHETEAGRADG